MRGAKEKEDKTGEQILASFVLELHSLSPHPLTRSTLPKLPSSKQPHCIVKKHEKNLKLGRDKRPLKFKADRLHTRTKANLQ